MNTLDNKGAVVTGTSSGIDHIDLARAKILVVGASGFLGRPLVRRLVNLDAEVTAVSRNPPAEADHTKWIAGDASDAAQMARLFERTRPDIVYILTSDSRGGPDLDFVQTGIRNDVVATINILVEATKHKCRHVVLTGSLDEPDGTAGSATPCTPYGAAKWVIGGYARMFMRLYGTPISILRPMMTYGPGQKNYKVIPSVIQALLQDQPARLGSGKRLVDWVYIDDVVEAFVRTAACTALNETIDLGSGTLVSVRDCALLIGGFIGRSHLLEFDPARDRPYEEVKAADTHPAAERLGWRATTALSDGLKRTIAAFELQLATSR
jgi:nucleoside-diphosphate-sugar epimerase